jgi:hypothetical protein
MKSARIPINFWRKPPFATAGDSQIGAWLKLVAYCFEHENGGLIADCKGWSNSCWLACTGTDNETVKMVCIQGLASWEDKGLRVTAYPIEDEAAYKKKVEGGRRGRESRQVGYAPRIAGSIAPSIAGQDRTGEEGTGESKEDAARRFLVSLGAKMERSGEDLTAEWRAATKGMGPDAVRAIFDKAKPGILWPSQFREWRAAQVSY